jgi:CubicO group peptidase (beta-lactamase class C family)
VQELAIKLVDQRHAPGIVIGVLNPDGSFFFSHGTMDWKSDQSVDENTLFEIGSITKVFTALLLANALENELVQLDTPAQDLLPVGVSMPSYMDKQITLQDLATHRSGLPRMPINFSPSETFNPYIDYGKAELYEFLSSYKLMKIVGAHYEYSNLGYMLLGHLIEKAYGEQYEALVIESIADPLGMPDTRITLSDEQKTRFAQGHTDVYPVPAWDFLLPGLGALRSSASDMLRFASANLGLFPSDLEAAMQRLQEGRHETGTPGIQTSLGWHTYSRYDKEIIWHDGQTGGYHSFLGILADEKTGVVVLVNSNYDIDAIGLHLLDPLVPLPALD